MTQNTIDTDEVIKIFRHFLDSNSPMRVLCVQGEAKMGKSHLLTKVFPLIAQQEYQFRHAVIDLRNQIHTVPDILSLTCSQFDRNRFPNYQKAYLAWVNQPKIKIEHVFLFLSSLTLSTKHEPDKTQLNLTTQFIKDLEVYDDQPLLLLIDHVNNATDKIQAWLMHTFLVQLSLLKHVRIVVAGQYIPEPHGRYLAYCQRYQLRPVTEEDAYIAYCQSLKVALVEQSICDIARLLDYRPGMFADYVLPKFWQPR